MSNSLSSAWKPRAVLFDFDGTLADSYPAITAGVNYVRDRAGLSPLSVEEVRPHVGHGPEHLLEQTVPGCNPIEAGRMYRTHHPSVMHQLTSLMPGAREALTALHAASVQVGVCSNKPKRFTLELLESLQLRSLMSVIIGPEDVTHPKPAADMLLLALQQLQRKASEVVYIGDMTIDIRTARAADVRVFIVPTGSDSVATLKAAHPDRLLTSLAELPGLLLG